MLTIRNLDDTVKARLRAEAGRQGVSMEEQARRILTTSLGGPAPASELPLGQAMSALFGGADAAVDELPVPPRRDQARGADFSA